MVLSYTNKMTYICSLIERTYIIKSTLATFVGNLLKELIVMLKRFLSPIIVVFALFLGVSVSSVHAANVQYKEMREQAELKSGIVPLGSMWVSAKFQYDGESVDIIRTDGGYSESPLSVQLEFKNHKINSWYDPEYQIAQVESCITVEAKVGIKKFGISMGKKDFQLFITCNKEGGISSGSNVREG